MGGNVVINGLPADKIDLSVINRKPFCEDLVESINKINVYFNKKFDYPLFPFGSMYQDCLSGSSKFLFNNLISTYVLEKIKPSFGDIDIMVPKETRSDLETFLTEFEGITYHKLRLIGFKNSNSQVISLWNYNDINIQIDFEFVDFDGIKPSEWAVFSHYSDWKDTTLGIKACMHKYLLQSVVGYDKQQITVMTGKYKTNPKEIVKSIMAFSVTHGLRQRYIEQDDGTWIELTTAESDNITDVPRLFSEMFSTESDELKLKLMYSFNGVVELIKKFHVDRTEQIADDFAERIFGKNSQKIVRDNIDQDRVQKMVALGYLCDELGLNKWKYSDLIQAYK